MIGHLTFSNMSMAMSSLWNVYKEMRDSPKCWGLNKAEIECVIKEIHQLYDYIDSLRPKEEKK